MPAEYRPRGWFVAGIIAGAIVLLAIAFAAPINHDENQYLAATLLTRTGRPYLDFAYLQTPLQLYLTAPLVGLAPSASLFLLRGLTALLGLLFLAFTYRACRACGATRDAAIGAILLLATTRSFLFSTAVFRNDMLPAVLSGAAMLVLLGRSSMRQIGLAGLALGLAASSKISYLLPLISVGAFLIIQWQKCGGPGGEPAAFSGGALVGLLPSILSFLRAPEQFTYGVFEFASSAPDLWYRANGYADRLGLSAKLSDSLAVFAQGASLVALLIVITDEVVRRRDQDRQRSLLNWLMVGGLIAALLPTPTWRQYFLPFLLPLFVRLSLVTWPVGRWRTACIASLLLSALTGPAPRLKSLVDAVSSGDWPLVGARRESRWIGATGSAHDARGSIATLSPFAMIDSGMTLDARFAAGPFVYRTADALDDARQRRLVVLSPRTLFASLDAAPPAAILVGYESGQNLDRFGLDRQLRRYAESRGYHRFRSPYGAAELYLAGAATTGH